MSEALVNLRLDHDRQPSQVIQEVKAVPNVKWVRLIFGPTDAVALVDAPHWLELEATVFKISAVQGVAGTDTRVLVPDKD